MVEQEMKDSGKEWHQVDIGNGHLIWEKTIDPEIMAQMPKTVRPFYEVGPIELLIEDIKHLFNIRGRI
ncbi:MAG: hypothetical protein UV71_C0001G0032 [Microgenomates group bacterium GW2011_GWC1_43_13]|uniref:Uncharacterized protein n=3 Tax=Candidatus Woeseibacteriota TaxID=1752722 RepID=A0A837IA27_9BACT|nr:MAG: hypothetical protein UV71_C0001G0032 [Microgenomates group bacterium GW2011_GWC1_43_13]KKT33509.1 MAG: hypothetical protein UW20_C0001G0020 [Candidatus Woesebacteria bacterium GW2011_GWB1_44_11]KKT54998.1 MAG: hypothetical protein UW47_C0001G0020 [Candidatus Woesebacteria bacterium GW2011_GWA1_44_23]OGM76724.1 MAG: hypothetical protein A2208_00440 [Candidatus Woesebacteria bacterium RIFOXYA1_FULL_43_16]OGM83297.1 MAG: hypothetical protein A2394_01425 [Candidatus Woesebacteria bacterium 